MIDKREVNLTPSDINNLMPTYSLCKGRRFSFQSQDGTSFKNISLNNLILVIKNAAVKKPEENISEINNFVEIFKNVKDKGYKTLDDQINQENFLTRIITKIKHFFSKTQRDNLFKELEQVAVRANSKIIVPENHTSQEIIPAAKKEEKTQEPAHEIVSENQAPGITPPEKKRRQRRLSKKNLKKELMYIMKN